MSASWRSLAQRGGLVNIRSKLKPRIAEILASGIRIRGVGKSGNTARMGDLQLTSIGIMITGKADHTLTTGGRAAGKFPKAASRRGRAAVRVRVNALDKI